MTGKKKICDDIFYVYFKKHFCPKCGTKMEKISCSELVHSNSPKAKKYDFELGNTFLVGEIEFIWDELKCSNCGMQISFNEKKKLEKQQKREKKNEKTNTN